MKNYFKNLGALVLLALTLFGCSTFQTSPAPTEPQAIDSPVVDPIAADPAIVEPPVVEPPAADPIIAEPPTVEDLIKKLFSAKYDKPISEININITAQDATHAKGGVNFSPGGMGNGGLFLAVKMSGKWKLIYDGNGSVNCPEIRDYGFTQDLLEGVCDPIADATMTVRVYFNNPDTDPNWAFECSNVLPVGRIIPQTSGIAMATIKELLKGPTSAEISSGYMTNINSGVLVQSLTIQNGVAYIDFNEQLQYQVGGSCKTSAIIAQIKQTLKQFSTVNDVVISINGETEVILQP